MSLRIRERTAFAVRPSPSVGTLRRSAPANVASPIEIIRLDLQVQPFLLRVQPHESVDEVADHHLRLVMRQTGRTAEEAIPVKAFDSERGVALGLREVFGLARLVVEVEEEVDDGSR